MSFFSVQHREAAGFARAGTLRFTRPEREVQVPTPAFMPVGTQGTVKALWQEQIEELGFDLILGNTYHLHLRPGDERIAALGGLHRFMGWRGAILTDSGGFQAFSLAERVKLQADGVEFASHIDGSRRKFSPQSTIDIQRHLGSDIMMVIDDCPPGDADARRVREALVRTHAWATASCEYYQSLIDDGRLDKHSQRLFGIVQGGIFSDLRAESLAALKRLPFSGIALGGFSVGESRADFHRTLRSMAADLDERPRYLMGVGTVPDILEAVACGIDMFDCVLPTRNARNGQFLTTEGNLNIRNARHAQDERPVDPNCACRVCARYSRAYLRHLFAAREMLGPQLATYHNLFFMRSFMRSLREAIIEDRFATFRSAWEKVEGPA